MPDSTQYPGQRGESTCITALCAPSVVCIRWNASDILNLDVAVDLEARQSLGQRCQAIGYRAGLLHLLGLALVIPNPFQPLDSVTQQHLICALVVEVEFLDADLHLI